MSGVPFSGEANELFRLGFGAMGLDGRFGEQGDEAMIASILFSLEQGVNFIDTARAYGRSEELVGKALKRWKGQRPFVATKVAAASEPAGYLPGAGFHYSLPVELAYPAGHVTQSVEESLRQLDVDCIDLVQMHQYWPQWDTSDYWMEELIRLREQGKLRFIGVSLPDHRSDLGIALARTGQIDSIQTVINIFDSIAFDGLVPICREHGVAVIARVIMDEGGLTGWLREDTKIPDTDYRHRYFDCVPRSVYTEKVERLGSYIPEHADCLAELAVRFVLSDPGVTVALTSMQVQAYAEANIQAARKGGLPAPVFNTMKVRNRWIRHFYHERRHMI
ncbi:aldo/keto reductase [Paenibacillus thalictri]|uniref:Aldo/keto reductase n=1 Tax=Paenibacillus thalictri TaxID=2527873 RepID=A0A4Q9E112_9BACL|nr:aldo/keto reductase [Paenibacillus thalictri]TBL81948.1 aldo/keto reductase [Paenibacillus thalictri]